MRSDLFAREIAAMAGRITILRQHRGASPEQPDVVADEAIQALDTSIEELRAAVEELSRKNEQLVALRQALEQERIRYRELFDQAPDGYVATDLQGVIREANRAASALLNIGTESLIGKPLLVFIPRPDRAALRAALLRLRDATKAAEYDLRLQPRHGSPVDVTLRVSVARDARGEPIAFCWLIRDVSARRPAEQTIRERNAALERRVVARSEQLESALQSRERWLIRALAATAEPEARGRLSEDLVQEADAILWTMDAVTGRYRFVSRRAEAILGYPVEHWLGDPGFWADHIHPDDREWAVAHRRRQLSEGRDFEAEYRLTAADGRDVWFREGVRILKDEQGRPRELRGLMVNISRRKEVERQLCAAKGRLATRLGDMTSHYELGWRLVGRSERESVLREILASLTAHLETDQGAVFLDDRRGGAFGLAAGIGLPEAFAARVGHLPERGGEPGNPLAAVAPVVVEDVEGDAAPPELKSLARAGGFRAAFGYPLLTREGGFLGTIAVFFRDPHRPTERQAHLMGLYARRVADSLEGGRPRGGAEGRDHGPGEFLALIAHELRNPIGTILNALHVLEPEGPHDGAALDHTREVIERQTRHMARLVDDLIDAARLRTGKLELSKGRVDLACVVARAVEATQPLLVARNHRLCVALPSEPMPILADPTRVDQILINLLNNAAKYTEPGGLIRLAVERHGDEVAIRVRDTGIGIAPELLPHIFDLYMQANPGAERSAKGLGIGLWLVRGLVERHGGSIAAHSAGPGLGSEFVVRLPLDPSGADHPAAPPVAAESAPPAARAPRSRRVLIVDDHPDSAHVLARLVRRWKHEASVVHDGPAALEEARRFRPDVVLLDIKLPGMDGFELARRLRESPDGTGMVLVGLSGTGSGRSGHKDAAPEFDHQLVKPVDPAALRRLIEVMS